jgi:phage gp29-like protein
VDIAGNIIFTEPEDAMKDALENFRNGSVIALPFGATVKTLDVQHIGSPFTDAIELCDRQIAKAILSQTLATEEGRYQARAAAQTHQDVLGLVVQNLKAIIAAVIKSDLLRALVSYNFGADMIHLTPDVSLTQTEQHDFAVNAQAIAGLYKSGYIHSSQMPQIDSMIGLPPRDPDAKPDEPAQAPAAPPNSQQQKAPPNEPAKTAPTN